MPTLESEAIILRSFPLGEGDRLVSFLSRSEGRLRGVASGARRPKSRFASTLEPLSYIRIWYYERETRDLVRINQCELIESFWDVQRDYVPGLVLATASEITEAVLGEREAADAHFRLLLLLPRFIKGGGNPHIALAYFALWAVRLGGWLPRLDRCGECGAELTASGYISEHSGLSCEQCRLLGQRQISKAALDISRKMFVGPLDQFMGTEAFPIDAVDELKHYMMNTVERYAEKHLKAWQLLRENTNIEK